MIRSAEAFPDEAIVSALRGELSWTLFREIINLGDSLKRNFYTEMRRIEYWSSRMLRYQIAQLLDKQTVLSKQAEEIARDLAALCDEYSPFHLDERDIRVARYFTELPPRATGENAARVHPTSP